MINPLGACVISGGSGFLSMDLSRESLVLAGTRREKVDVDINGCPGCRVEAERQGAADRARNISALSAPSVSRTTTFPSKDGAAGAASPPAAGGAATKPPGTPMSAQATVPQGGKGGS